MVPQSVYFPFSKSSFQVYIIYRSYTRNMITYTRRMSVFDKCNRNPDNLKHWLRFLLGYTYTIMWRGYRGNRLRPCFPTDVYDRNMATDIWLIQPYVIAWEKAWSYVIAWTKYLLYIWYLRVYTKYILGFILNTLYTSVYDSIYQVYTSI